MPRPSAKLYASVQLIQIARDSVRASQTNTLSAITGIAFSAFTLEAIVNELLDRIRDSSMNTGDAEIAKISAVAHAAGLYEQRGGTEQRIRVLMAALVGADPSTPPHWYLEYKLLIQVRNFIVHTRPESRSQGNDGDWPVHRILKELANRKIVRVPRTPEFSAAMNELQNYNVAKWAFDTMIRTVQELVALFPATFRDRHELDKYYGASNLDL
jgi:hypothetical protein